MSVKSICCDALFVKFSYGPYRIVKVALLGCESATFALRKRHFEDVKWHFEDVKCSISG